MFEVGKRRLGSNGPEVSAIGLGCMGMSEFYGAGSEQESIATIHHALERGVTFLDTADMYGVGHERGAGRPRDRATGATRCSSPPSSATSAAPTASSSASAAIPNMCARPARRASSGSTSR